MNIFALHRNPWLSPALMFDKHIVKMPLETTQLVCTHAIACGADPADVPYKPTHQNHPCRKWLGATAERPSMGNLSWLFVHGFALFDEYTHRFGRRHKSQDVLLAMFRMFASNFSDWRTATPPPMCMPDDCKRGGDTPNWMHVQVAYRRYYATKIRAVVDATAAMPKYTNRRMPSMLIRRVHELTLDT